MKHSIYSISCNNHTARDLRRRLENRHSVGTATRNTLDRLSDDELIRIFLQNEQRGRAHSAKQRAKKEGIASA